MPKPKPSAVQSVRKRIVVIDDHALIRRGLAAMINNEPDLEVCGEAASHQAALAEITAAQPDLVTVDLSLGESDGLELVKDLRILYPNLPVLVLSMHDEALYAERAFRAGAHGYITKQQMDDTVLTAIRCVLGGNQYMSPAVGARFAEQYLAGNSRKKSSQLAGLSDREFEVFRLIGEGKGTRQIAERLKLSVKTIESYREHLKTKLALASGVELARAATCWVATGKVT
jgi:DNA-binding NarL/FixJ family response regulator